MAKKKSKMDSAIDAAVAGSERRRARQATAAKSKPSPKPRKKRSTSIIKEGVKSIKKGHARTKKYADKY